MERCTECLKSQPEGHQEFPWVVYHRGHPDEVRFCLGHAYLGTCPDDGCGTSAFACHLTGCGSCVPVNPSAAGLSADIYEAETLWGEPPDEHVQCVFCYGWFHPNVIAAQGDKREAGIIISSCQPCLDAVPDRDRFFN